MKKMFSFSALAIFTCAYLAIGTVVFWGTANIEFVIYIAVIVAIFSAVLALHRVVQFPVWMLWLLSIWGLMHVLGGAVQIGDHVLFAHHIFPLIDKGGEFYILKYDQVVHFYLYGLVAVMSHYVVRTSFLVRNNKILLSVLAVLISVGISGLNEIMEFFISLGMENGVGGYDNTMLDMCFNLLGATLAIITYTYFLSKNNDLED